jgi:hypothetical protein
VADEVDARYCHLAVNVRGKPIPVFFHPNTTSVGQAMVLDKTEYRGLEQNFFEYVYVAFGDLVLRLRKFSFAGRMSDEEAAKFVRDNYQPIRFEGYFGLLEVHLVRKNHSAPAWTRDQAV